MNLKDDFEFVGRGPKYLDSPFTDNDSSLFKDAKEDASFTTKQFGASDKANFHSSKVKTLFFFCFWAAASIGDQVL